MADTPRSKTAVVAGVILARDEAGSIAEAVRSLRAVTDRVLVVDSESTDETADIARDAGATVVVRAFRSFSEQRNFATDEAAQLWGADWIFSLDADEIVSDALAAECREFFRSGRHSDYDIGLVQRRLRFAGRDLRFGGASKTLLARLFRSRYRYESRAVNEHLQGEASARTVRMRGIITHRDVDDWERYFVKQVRFATLEAQTRSSDAQAFPVSWRDLRHRPDLRRRWVVQHVWTSLPARPIFRFVFVYIVRGGFLDGSAGLAFATCQAWKEVMFDVNLTTTRSSNPQHD